MLWAAEELGAFELAQLWADCTARPISERTAYDELAELATMSALAKWLTRWQPIAIHSAARAGARMESIAGALGNSLQVAFDRWHEWASRQRNFIVGGKPGITDAEYEAVARRFAAVGSSPSEAGWQCSCSARWRLLPPVTRDSDATLCTLDTEAPHHFALWRLDRRRQRTRPKER
jgi:hypothetical protein